MKKKLETEVKEIGNLSSGLINNNYLVLFDETLIDPINHFGFTAKNNPIIEEIKIGDTVKIGNNEYLIKEISNITNETLKKITHVTFVLDKELDDNNQILLEGEKFPNIEIGTKIEIF